MKRLMMICALVVLAGCAPVATAQVADPYVLVAQAQRTAEAAQNKADYYSGVMTFTAQAPIVAITQTSAAMAFMQTQVSVNYTATAMAWTPTIVPSATPNAMATVQMAQAQMQATVAANDAELSNKAVERAESTNFIRSISVYVIGLVGLVMLAMFAVTWAKRLAVLTVPVDERGRHAQFVDVIEGVAVDMGRAANGAMSLRGKDLAKLLPVISAERQNETTARAQVTRMPRLEPVEQRLLSAPAVGVENNFLLPAWDIVNGWGGEGIPYYTARGLEVIDIDQYPHFSVLGMTGSRKSRGFLRPMIACALAAGHRVVIIGKSADYWPFESHVNATLLKVSQITKPEQAVKYATILSALVAEMNRRDEVLTAQRKSTWTHAGHCRTFVVLDELGNALRLMDRDMSNRSRLWVEGLVMEGRKVGFSIALANQRATGMASILSQTGKAIFRVESDEEKAHKSLMGASSLRDGYFLAKFGASKLAGAFEPTDEEIRSFLASRPVDKIEDDDWIDGQLVGADQVEAGSEAAALLPDNNELGHDDYLKVIDLLDAGKSPSAVVRELWGVTGGSKFLRLNEQVKKLYEGMKGVTA